MKNTILSSASKIVARFSVPREKRITEAEIVDEAFSYRPFVEEIIQEIQFTHVPLKEKKTRKMIVEINATG